MLILVVSDSRETIELEKKLAELNKISIYQKIVANAIEKKVHNRDLWASLILKYMKENNLPITKNYIALILATIERESDFRVDPLIPNPDYILHSMFKVFCYITDVIEYFFSNFYVEETKTT